MVSCISIGCFIALGSFSINHLPRWVNMWNPFGPATLHDTLTTSRILSHLSFLCSNDLVYTSNTTISSATSYFSEHLLTSLLWGLSYIHVTMLQHRPSRLRNDRHPRQWPTITWSSPVCKSGIAIWTLPEAPISFMPRRTNDCLPCFYVSQASDALIEFGYLWADSRPAHYFAPFPLIDRTKTALSYPNVPRWSLWIRDEENDERRRPHYC